MQKVLAALLALLMTASSCQKEAVEVANDPAISRTSLPYESTAIRVRIASTSVPSQTTDLHFFNETTGVALTADGKIYVSADRGSTWALKYRTAAANQPLHQLLFTDQHRGYVVGGNSGCLGSGCIPPGSILLQTTDGGNTWTSVYEEKKSDFIAVAVNAAGTLFLAANGPHARILRRTQADATWSVVDSTTNQVSTLVFNDRAGFYTGSGARIVRSDDNGRTWGHQTSLSYNYVNDLAFSQHVGYYLLGYSELYRTTDNGDTWQQARNPLAAVYKLTALTPTSCLLWGAGPSSGRDFPVVRGAVGQTQDGGTTWTGVEFEGIDLIRVASFYTPQQGYAVAGNTLLHVTVK